MPPTDNSEFQSNIALVRAERGRFEKRCARFGQRARVLQIQTQRVMRKIKEREQLTNFLPFGDGRFPFVPGLQKFCVVLVQTKIVRRASQSPQINLLRLGRRVAREALPRFGYFAAQPRDLLRVAGLAAEWRALLALEYIFKNGDAVPIGQAKPLFALRLRRPG